MRPSLLQTLKQLRLSGLAESLEVRLSEASGNRLDHAEFLELILQDELNVRLSRLVSRRVKSACFGEVKNLDEFDFSFNPSIKRKQIHDLASCSFLRDKADVLLLGPPGVGKTFLVQAIGHQAIKAGFMVLYRSIFDLARDFLGDEDPRHQDKTLNKYLKPDLLIIDDMGMKQLPRRSGECLLEIIMRRHENRSTMMTSNRPLEDWAKLIGDVPAATAILDRFLQHATLINITGRSYRLRHGSNEEAKTRGRRTSVSSVEPNTAGNEGCPPRPATNSVESKTPWQIRQYPLLRGLRRITRLDRKLITQKKVASDRADEVYEAPKRWLVLNAVIAHIKWLGLKRLMTFLQRAA